VLTDPEWEALKLSALVGAGATALVMPPAIVLGRAMAASSFRGKALVESVLLLPLVLPPVVTGYLLLILFGRRGPVGPALDAMGMPVVFTWRACVIASAVMAFPLAYRVCRTGFESVDPRLPAAARTLGASRADAFLTVTLPLARRSVFAATALAFARAVGELCATMVVAGNVEGETRTVPVAVFQEIQSNGTDGAWRLAAICVVLAAGPLIASEFLVRRARR